MARRYTPGKDCVIIAEGYFDLLTLHQSGLKHSVATLGTALTTQHIRTLKRYTKNLITLFDADQAGVQASLRSLPLFLEEEISGRTIVLPNGEDPDSFLRKGKVEDLERRVTGAVPLMDFFFENLIKTYNVKSIDGKVKIAEEGMALIGKIPDGIRRDFYLKALAERLDVEAPLLHEMLRSSPKGRPKVEKELKRRVAEKNLPRSEEMVVRLMVHHPELIPRISEEGILKEFESPLLKKMAEDLENFYQTKGRLDIAEALGSLDEDLKGRLSEMVFQESGIEGSHQEKILEDCIQRIHKKKLEKDKSDLLRRIKEAEKQIGEKGLEELLLKRQELARRERSLPKESLRKE